ncbi:potassium channel family protein [Pseudokineococcus basanitobsidens]|uniref:Potassium channel family protein n=1 Tax=Pseudokineococcus basanitobsidens TaxID=1926649 RepID=A0ABU8RKX5_9ACTN
MRQIADDDRRHRWEKRSEWPLTAAALVFLVAYAVPVLDTSLPPDVADVVGAAGWVVWGAFLVDYVVRLALSERRWRFVRRHPLDLAVVVLPLLRPLRLLRLVTLISVLNRHAASSLRGRVAVYVAGATTLVVVVAALAALDAERGAPGALIETFPQAVWWAITTVTTVGYGDFYPVTDEGRAVAVGLMVTGVALLGTVTASLASWLLDRVREVEETQATASRQDVEALAAEVAALRAALVERRSVDLPSAGPAAAEHESPGGTPG